MQIILQVNFELSRHFNGTPLDVFGSVAGTKSDSFETEPWQKLIAEFRD